VIIVISRIASLCFGRRLCWLPRLWPSPFAQHLPPWPQNLRLRWRSCADDCSGIRKGLPGFCLQEYVGIT